MMLGWRKEEGNVVDTAYGCSHFLSNTPPTLPNQLPAHLVVFRCLEAVEMVSQRAYTRARCTLCYHQQASKCQSTLHRTSQSSIPFPHIMARKPFSRLSLIIVITLTMHISSFDDHPADPLRQCPKPQPKKSRLGLSSPRRIL